MTLREVLARLRGQYDEQIRSALASVRSTLEQEGEKTEAEIADHLDEVREGLVQFVQDQLSAFEERHREIVIGAARHAPPGATVH